MPTIPLGKNTITEDARRLRALLNVTGAMGLAYLPSHTHSGPGDGGSLDLDTTLFIDGTEGSVLFIGPGGVVSQDNDNLFWDDASDYLGVGTVASPDRTLHAELDDATYDTPLYVLRLTRTTSDAGHGQAGIGVGIEFETEDDGGGMDVLAAVQGISSDVSAGAEHGALLFLTADVGDDGLTERCRVDHDGTLYPATAGYDLGTTTNYWDIYTREAYFQGGTGTNLVQVPDNVADAWHLQDAGALEYVKVISTDAQPVVRFNDGGYDIDFEVEASGVPDALQVRGSDGQITLGALTAGFVKSDANGVLSVGTIGVGDLPAHDLLSAQHGDTVANAVTRGSLVYGDTTPDWNELTIGAAGTYLRSDGTDPSWSAIQAGDWPAHNLLSTQHGDTTTDAVTRGSLIYGNSTPNWDELVIGGAGTYLRSDGTDPSWSSISAGDLPAHNLLSAQHGDTTTDAVTRGSLVYGNSSPAWDELLLGAAYTHLESNGTDVAWQANLTMADNAWIGLGAAAGRLVFDSTPSPDQLEVTAADLNFVTSGRGIIHVDGNTSGWILQANGTRYVPTDPAGALPIPPVAQGDMLIANAVPAWSILTLGGTAGSALVTTATTAAWDNTPTWTGSHTWDDGVGDSPHLLLVGGSNNDTARIYLDDDATAGDSDLVVRLCDAAGDSHFIVEDSGAVNVLEVDSDGNVTMSEDRWIGLGSAAARFVFNSTPTPDEIRIVAADFDLNNYDLILDSDGDTYLHAAADDRAEFVLATASGQLDININGQDQYNFGATQLTVSDTGGTPRLYLRTHGATDTTGADVYADDRLGLAGEFNVDVFIDANNDQTTAHFGVYKDAETENGATELFTVDEDGTVTLMNYIVHQGDADTYIYYRTDRMTLHTGGVDMVDCVEAATDYVKFHAGLVCINETANAFQTIGLTINQGTNDDEALALKSPTDVNHGMTNEAENDTFLTLTKVGAVEGGANMRGYTEGTIGVALVGRYTSDDATTTSSSYAAVMTFGQKDDGAGNVGNVGAAANMFGVRARRGGSNQTVMLVNEDGNLYLDAAVTENDWDGYDDAALLTGLRASLMPAGHPFRRRFAEWMGYARPVLEATGVVRYNDDGHHFVELKALGMLTVDAVRQLYERCARYERVLLALGADPALLEA